DDVPLQQSGAAEPTPVLEAAAVGITLLDRAEGRQVRDPGCDAELGKFAFTDLDLAAAADAAPAAHRIDVDAEAARSLEDRRPEREPPALARRHEHDEGIGLRGAGVHASAPDALSTPNLTLKEGGRLIQRGTSLPPRGGGLGWGVLPPSTR